MKAIEISSLGGPEVLRVCERPRPVINDGEILIRVAAAGVNRPDLLQRQGKYPPPQGASDLPGLEVSGEIVDSRSSRWQSGDKVCALLTGGGYAEYVATPAGQCLPIPDGLSITDAGALPETAFTVWDNLVLRGALKSGETTLIHGGASGIGTMAIQIAKALGARVVVTAGTDSKCAACKKLGADLAVHYKSADFVAAIEAAWGKHPVDVVLDMVGGVYVARNLSLLKPGGRHVSIAVQGGKTAEIDLTTIMQRRLILTGSTMRPRSVAEKSALAVELRKDLWPLVASGKVKPVIFRTFPLEQAAQAHAALEAGDHVGKVVLTNEF